jgi:hypothetical protein
LPSILLKNITMKRILNTLLILLLSMQLFAQEKTITGTVVGADDGEPLPGATVVVKGTTTGTITDLNGQYSIKVPEAAEELEFRFVGMLPKTVEIGDKNEINVSLAPDLLEVEEVVVTAIGIRREKKALGYAVQEIDEENINKSNSENVINALSGKVAGVRINSSSGAAGASSLPRPLFPRGH